MKLIRCLVQEAQKRGYTCLANLENGWTVEPVTVSVCVCVCARRHRIIDVQTAQNKVLQHNGYDCGVWVFAAIVAALRGYHRPSLPEGAMPALRKIMFELAYTVPHA